MGLLARLEWYKYRQQPLGNHQSVDHLSVLKCSNNKLSGLYHTSRSSQDSTMKMSLALSALTVALIGHVVHSAPGVIQQQQNVISSDQQGQYQYAQAAPSYDPQAKPTPYDFGYEVKDEYGATQARQESGDGSGAVKGTYGYTDPNGLFRQVDYIADEYGFRVNVKTNEPGTTNQSPADVVLVAEEPPAGLLIQRAPIQQQKILVQQQGPPKQVVGLSQFRPVPIQTQGYHPVVAQAHYPVGVQTQGYHPVVAQAHYPVGVHATAYHPVATHAIHQVSSPVHVVAAHPQTYYSPVATATKVTKVITTAPGGVIKTGPIGAAVVRSYGPYYDH